MLVAGTKALHIRISGAQLSTSYLKVLSFRTPAGRTAIYVPSDSELAKTPSGAQYLSLSDSLACHLPLPCTDVILADLFRSAAIR